MTAPFGREVAAQDRERRPRRTTGSFARPDDVVVVDLAAPAMFSPSVSPFTVSASGVEQVAPAA